MEPALPDFAGTRALVTGASSGVGLAAARQLLRAGATVHGIARRREKMIEGAGAQAVADGTFVPHAADVSRPAEVADAVAAAAAGGPLDVVVLAAGINIPDRAFGVLTPDALDALIGINLSGAYYVLRAVMPHLARGATVVFVSSVSGRWPDGSGAAYQAAKAGMVALANAVAYERAGDGVRFSAILPGLIDTPILDYRPQPVPPDVRARALRPEDVASACLFLAALPPHVLIPELTILPVQLQAIGRTTA